MSGRVLVLNCFVKGWNILKRLADDGYKVNGGDYRPGAPGLNSNRIADKSKNLIYPNPKIDEDAFVDAVAAHIEKENFDIVLPVNAAEMMALAKHRDRITKQALFPFENYYKLLLLHDKKYFFELMAANIGQQYLPHTISIGDTTPPTTEILIKAGITGVPCDPIDNYQDAQTFLNANNGIVFPLIVKTRRSTSSVGVYRVRNAQEFEAACNNLENADIIVQENIIGRGVGISSIRWDNPAFIHHFGHKRVREYPISGGASTSREPWPVKGHPIAQNLSGLLDTLNWHGVVMFELKEINRGDGFEYKFLEANPRFWGSVPLAIVNGINFPVLLCRAAQGRDIPEATNLNKIRARILFSDTLSYVLNILHGRRIVYNTLDYFNFRRLYLDDIDFSDWPGTKKITGQMISEFFARIVKKR
ncbi:MAG: hypothetical protein R3F48_03995 [Candidatus Zixiibacteriota bacterium]